MRVPSIVTLPIFAPDIYKTFANYKLCMPQLQVRAKERVWPISKDIETPRQVPPLAFQKKILFFQEFSAIGCQKMVSQ